MSDIKPIDLPTAAGVEFGRGDVRHFSEDDAIGVVGLQTPTRHLAERDNILAEKLNEVVGVVNNKEQFVPLTVPRTGVAPGVEEIVTNFKIPDGFEARILSASVGSNPVSAAITLKIYYSPSYGSVTGTELISTSSTFNSGVAFYNSGEFIVALRNNSAASLEIAASITLTIRPIGSTASLLVGSVIQGRQGFPGRKGDLGGQGNPGVGGTGSPGLVYRGTFNAANSYAPPDVVSWTTGGVTQSYVSILANPGPGSALPSSPTYWSLLASAGSAGNVGITWMGPWSSATAYSVNDAVSYSVGVTSSYICTAAVGPSITYPGADPAHWDILAGPSASGAVSSQLNIAYGTIYYDSGYQAGSPDGGYLALGAPSTALAVQFYEASILNSTTAPFGVAFLRFQQHSVFSGTQTVSLPNLGSGASVNWTGTDVVCQLTLDGTAATSPDTLVNVTVRNTGTVICAVNNSTPVRASLGITGFQQIS